MASHVSRDGVHQRGFAPALTRTGRAHWPANDACLGQSPRCALDAYRRQLFFDRLNAGYAELQADPEAWAEHLAERKDWDTTLMDGLDAAEHWTEDGRCVDPKGEKP